MWEFNEYQTQLTDKVLASLSDEELAELEDVLTNVEFVKRLVSKDRKRAKDLDRDQSGRIIVDLSNPHILEDMDYFREAAIHFQKYGCYTKLMPNPNPQSEYGQWLKREVRRIWQGMVRPSDGEWIPGDMYFYLNYFPIVQTKIKKGTKIGERVTDLPEVWEGVYWRFHYMHQARFGGLYDDFKGAHHGCEIARRGAAHPYSQTVITPEGTKLWSEINIGDKLFGPDGDITTVIDIPFDDECDVYKMTLKDCREVYCSDNHLWNVYKRTGGMNAPITIPLKSIAKDYKRNKAISDRNPNGLEYIYSIPSNSGVEFSTKQTYIEPYTFGLLLGDGTFRHSEYVHTVVLTAAEEDVKTYRLHIPYKISSSKKRRISHSIEIPGVTEYLKSVGLFMKKSEGKFIPDEYKYNSKDVRMKVLMGLMDSDGMVSKGKPSFSTVSKALSDDVLWIARSLGYNCLSSRRKARYKKDGIYIECLDVYNITFYTNDRIFNLERKLNRLSGYPTAYSKSKKDMTRIVNIELSHREKCKCVTVDNESHSYLIGDFVQTHNSKSYSLGAVLTKTFLLGENELSRAKVKSLALAYQKEYLIKDGLINKFVDGLTHCAKYTQFPSNRIKSSWTDMHWVLGFKNDDDDDDGLLNEMIGVAIKDNSDKARGKRSSKVFYEEFGMFPGFLDLWQTSLPNVQEGEIVFGQAYSIGTGGTDGSDFSGALEMINYPSGYNVYSLPNVYDRGADGSKRTIFFFPGYVNSKGYYNKDGVSDVVGALISEIKFRVVLKYNSSDPMQLTRRKAETAFTLQDAIMRSSGTAYPADMLNDRINELNLDPKYPDSMWIGRLSMNNEGNVEYKVTPELKYITEFPHKDNKKRAAVCIKEQPKKDSAGKIPWGRYIAGADVYDDDGSNTLSLFSLFILDTFTDELVFEYTGRNDFADDDYEIARLACLYYNAELNYENNKKGLFKHFSKHGCLYLLSDTLEYLKDKDVVKGNLYGNKSKGTGNYGKVGYYARRAIREWLLHEQELITVKEENGVPYEDRRNVTMINKLWSKALCQELAMWNIDGNFDRHDALAMLMLLREDKLRMRGTRSMQDLDNERSAGYLGNDPFFEKNYKSSKRDNY